VVEDATLAGPVAAIGARRERLDAEVIAVGHTRLGDPPFLPQIPSACLRGLGITTVA
jgi:hypothetical protein